MNIIKTMAVFLFLAVFLTSCSLLSPLIKTSSGIDTSEPDVSESASSEEASSEDLYSQESSFTESPEVSSEEPESKLLSSTVTTKAPASSSKAASQKASSSKASSRASSSNTGSVNPGSAQSVSSSNTISLSPAPAKLQEYVNEVVKLVNIERAKKSLAPLTANNTKLNQAAQLRAEEIVKKFEHERPDGSSCFTVLVQAGLTYKTCGENIASGQQTPEAVVTAWMNSEGHRKNILKPEFAQIGVGYFVKDGTPHWVQLFFTAL